MLRQRAVLARFGGIRHGYGHRALVASGLRDYLTTPEYTARDLWRQARDPAFSLRALMPDKLTVDLMALAPSLSVPAWFIAGVHDQITPNSLVEKYVGALDAPAGKHLVPFEHSAHYSFLAEPRRFEGVIRDAVASAR